MRMALMRGVSLVGFGVQSLGGHGLIRMMMRLQPRVRSMSLANWLGAEQSTDWGNWLRWIGDHEVLLEASVSLSHRMLVCGSYYHSL
jgi:hypothetical protein